MKLPDALKILIKQEAENLIDHDKVVQTAIDRAVGLRERIEPGERFTCDVRAYANGGQQWRQAFRDIGLAAARQPAHQ